jgi:hypothetical protein
MDKGKKHILPQKKRPNPLAKTGYLGVFPE